MTAQLRVVPSLPRCGAGLGFAVGWRAGPRSRVWTVAPPVSGAPGRPDLVVRPEDPVDGCRVVHRAGWRLAVPDEPADAAESPGAESPGAAESAAAEGPLDAPGPSDGAGPPDAPGSPHSGPPDVPEPVDTPPAEPPSIDLGPSEVHPADGWCVGLVVIVPTVVLGPAGRVPERARLLDAPPPGRHVEVSVLLGEPDAPALDLEGSHDAGALTLPDGGLVRLWCHRVPTGPRMAGVLRGTTPGMRGSFRTPSGVEVLIDRGGLRGGVPRAGCGV